MPHPRCWNGPVALRAQDGWEPDRARCATLPRAGNIPCPGPESTVSKSVNNRPSRSIRLGFWVLVAAALLAACAPNPTAQLISPNMVAITEAGIVLIVKEVPKLAELTRDQVMADVPAEIVAAIEAGDIEEGMRISELQGCAGCHSLVEDEVLSGPSWYDIGNTAVGRVDDEGPALYLYNSITSPNSFVVRRFDSGVMPDNFVDTLSDQELGHLLALLLSQVEN